MANVLKMDRQATIRSLLELGWSYREIERTTGIRRETIARYDPNHPRYAGGSSEAKPAKVPTEPPDENRPKCPPTPDIVAPPERRPTRSSLAAPHDAFIRGKLKAGLSAQRIYQDLVVEEGYAHGYDSVKRYVRRLKAKGPAFYGRILTAPGEEAQVDFGQGAPTRKGSRYVRPWLFKMVLSYSRHSYEEVVWSQDVETFIRCHERAFDAFGGTPRIVLLDNLKAGVLKANLYEPQLNPVYEAFGRHAGFVPLPCLPGKPEHKGKTESGIGFTQDNALKGLRFESLEAQNAHLRNWNRTWARTRIHGTTKKQVYAVFLEEERAALNPLVLAPFPYFHVGTRSVHPDGNVEVERGYYPVPPDLLARTVTVHYNRQYVKVLDEASKVVAFHRAVGPGSFQTDVPWKHPERKGPRTYEREAYKTYLLIRLRNIGPNCRRWADAVLKDRGALGLRSLKGVIQLKDKYADAQIDAACREALRLGSFRYGIVARLLEAEQTSTTRAAAAPDLLQEHPMLRPLSEYQLFLDGLDEAGSQPS
jgi:transposase